MRNLTEAEIEKINHTRVGRIVHLHDIDLIICKQNGCDGCIGDVRDSHNCLHIHCQNDRCVKLLSTIIGEEE